MKAQQNCVSNVLATPNTFLSWLINVTSAFCFCTRSTKTYQNGLTKNRSMSDIPFICFEARNAETCMRSQTRGLMPVSRHWLNSFHLATHHWRKRTMPCRQQTPSDGRDDTDHGGVVVEDHSLVEKFKVKRPLLNFHSNRNTRLAC